MKDLYSIYEKLDLSKTNLYYFADDFANGFPVDANVRYNDCIKYLEDNNFKEIPWPTDFTVRIDDFIDNFNHEHCLVFTHTETTRGVKVIRFADTSKKDISKKNPIFCMYFDPRTPSYPDFYIECNKYWETTLQPDKWQNELKKCF